MYKILIVDDEDGIRNGLSNCFPWNSIGYEVVGQAVNGRRALNIYENIPVKVDVVLTDIQMPVMDGFEFVERLVRKNYTGKIVLLSAYNDFEYARKGLRLGVYDYILKPIDFNSLINIFIKLKEELDGEKNNNFADIDEYTVSNKPGFNYKEKIINETKQYINQNFCNANLTDAACHVNLSSSYLSVLFHNETGISFSEYLIKIKLKKAKEMLDDNNYKTYEISNKLGYRNPKNFTRAFKKNYGFSPREYKNMK